MKTFILSGYLLISILLCNFSLNLPTIKAEDACRLMPDGREACDDKPNGERHNIWTKSVDHDDIDSTINGASENVKNPDSKLTEIQGHLFDLFAGQLKDWNPDKGLAMFEPEVIVLAILNAFNVVDENDDGLLEYEEVEKFLQKRQVQDLSNIKEELAEYTENKISIFSYLNMFKRFNSGKEFSELVKPFENLRYMSPANAKKIIQGSANMFIDSDKNNDGKLEKDEFTFGMEQAQRKRVEMGGESVDVTGEQLDALFSVVDKDRDGYLSYKEFQGTMPHRQKTFKESIDEVFSDADKNGDDELSEVEFTLYMANKSKKQKAKIIPSDKEILDAFNKLDVNEDGSLNRDEMMNMFEEVKKAQELRIIEAFNSFDTDANGSLSLDELQQIVKGVEQTSGQKLDVKVFMAMLDQNLDKKVTLDEMTAILSKMIK